MASVPVVFVGETLAGHGLLLLLGDDPAADESIPLGHLFWRDFLRSSF